MIKFILYKLIIVGSYSKLSFLIESPTLLSFYILTNINKNNSISRITQFESLIFAFCVKLLYFVEHFIFLLFAPLFLELNVTLHNCSVAFNAFNVCFPHEIILFCIHLTVSKFYFSFPFCFKQNHLIYNFVHSYVFVDL